MCGINGILRTAGQPVEEKRIAAMNQSLAHRGPDAEGVFCAQHVGLGHRRLSIIDTSADGNQPFFSEDKRYVLVFNGELYNYLELKSQLAPHVFKTSCDTEVVLAAFQKWGKACLQRFNGMFAFAIWDKLEESLWLVRDRLGIKPLYLHEKDNTLVFSSEIRALLASGLVDKKLDQKGLTDYLRYQTVHAPDTIVEGVKMLPAGHYLEVKDNEIITHKYWDFTQNETKAAYLERPQIEQEIRQRLTKSIGLRMRADVPFGAFLSGGIDSSAIVGLMSNQSELPVNTFSVVFEEEKEFSEAPFARMIAKKFKTDHTEIVLKANDFLDMIPDALAAMDHPSGDGPNTYVVSGATKKKGITMALSGLGGDELFAGYDVFKRAQQLQDKKWIMSFPRGMRNMGTSLLKTVKPGVSADKIAETLNQDYLEIDYWYPIVRQVFLEKQVQEIATYKVGQHNNVQEILRQGIIHGTTGFDLPLLSKISFAEVHTYMQNVLLRDSDQMSMAHALEVRVPFLDHELVEFVTQIPDDIKNPTTPKKLLIDSLGDLLPDEVVNRKKMGFTLPWDIWMKNELRGFCEDALQNLGKRPYFNAKALENIWQQFLKGDPRVKWSRIWPLVVLEDWMKKTGVE